MNRAQLHSTVQAGKCRYRHALQAILGAAIFLLLTSMAGAQVFSTPAEISNGAPGGLPQIAVDAGNNIDVAWSTGKGVFFTRSTDAGKQFASPLTVSISSVGATFQMLVDHTGNIYLLWQSSDMHFLLSRSGDGRSFSTPADLTVQLNMSTFSGALPEIAVDSGGNVDLVWSQYGASGGILFSRSSDGGVTFSAPVQVGSFRYSAKAQIAIGSTGVIYLLWTEETTQTGGTCALRFNRSMDSGTTFSSTQTLNAADGECDAKLQIDVASNVNVLSFDGNGTYYRSSDEGKTFSTSQNVFTPTTVWFGGQLNADQRGEISTVLNSFPNHNILFSRSTNGGATFSTPLLVSASHPISAAGGAFGGNNQAMAIDSSGNVNVVWQDDISTPGSADIFFSRSSDGSHFSSAQNISNHPGSGSPAMALDSSGNVNVVWASDDASRVFFSRASVSAAGGFTISASPSSLTILPGGTANAQLTLTANGGFNDTVSLSCGNLPSGTECTFNPAVLTPSTTGTKVGVAVTVPPTLSTGGFPFTITAASASSTQFQPMQISAGVLTGEVTPSATVIPVGGAAEFAVTVVSSGNLAGQFSLGCSAPPGVSCTFSPSSAFVPTNGKVSSILKVSVLSQPATGSAPKLPHDLFPPSPGQRFIPVSAILILLISALTFAGLRQNTGLLRKRSWRVQLARSMAGTLLVVGVAAAILSCGGSVSTSKVGTGLTVGTASTSGISGTGGTGGMGGTGGSAGAGGTTTGGVTTFGSTSVTFPLTVLAFSGGSTVNVGTVSVTVP